MTLESHLLYRDENGIGHFYGHAAKSAEVARRCCSGYTRDPCRETVELVRLHDLLPDPQPRWVRRWLARLGPVQLRLIELKRADVRHRPRFWADRLEECTGRELLSRFAGRGQLSIASR